MYENSTLLNAKILTFRKIARNKRLIFKNWNKIKRYLFDVRLFNEKSKLLETI